jgi:hypothetical protein
MLNNQTNTNMKKPFTLQDEILTESIVPVLIEKALVNFEMHINMLSSNGPVVPSELEEYQEDMQNAVLNHISILSTITKNLSCISFLKISLGELAVILIANDDALDNIWNILFNRNFEEFTSCSWTSAVHPDGTPE